jgi:hypothetical protein
MAEWDWSWREFNETGIELAKMVKVELGGEADINGISVVRSMRI